MQAIKVSVGIALFGAALQVAALTLGATQGTVWIGQPLDVSVMVQRDAASPTTELCPDAPVNANTAAAKASGQRPTAEQRPAIVS